MRATITEFYISLILRDCSTFYDGAILMRQVRGGIFLPIFIVCMYACNPLVKKLFGATITHILR